jgi:predicted RNase H-like HicB family nuclease
LKRYRIVYALDESGHWIATVPRVRGCHSYGRSLSEARANIREALGLFVEDAVRAVLSDDVRLPADMRRLVAAFRAAREHAERDTRRAHAAARRLARRLGLRDTAELLNISHQRVHQLARRA